jgi:hydrogenase nickel incorporation protein HypB
VTQVLSSVIKASKNESYDVELAEDLLKANEEHAAANRNWFGMHGIRVIEVIGAVGTGKTSLVENLVKRLRDNYTILAIAGDLGTTIDSSIIARQGVAVMQINTGRECHLDANLVSKTFSKIEQVGANLVFIENVGNLICPSEFPLGAERRLVVLSLTEGQNMALKHPLTIMVADVVAINKMDLAGVLDVNPEALVRDIKTVNPKADTVMISCKTGEGFSELIKVLELQA